MTTPMNCEELLRHLFAWIDGEVGATRDLQIRSHLDQCRACFSRVEFEIRLKAHLRELGSTAVAPEFEDRIRRVLDTLTTR
jgi:anti-sigma factor (TIGR02949 family)